MSLRTNLIEYNNSVISYVYVDEKIYLKNYQFFVLNPLYTTLRSQIEGYTRLLIFRKFSTLPAVIWASPLINFQENFQPSCFFTYTSEKFSTLPAVIWASPLIKFEERFQPTLLLEPPLVLETQEYIQIWNLSISPKKNVFFTFSGFLFAVGPPKLKVLSSPLIYS